MTGVTERGLPNSGSTSIDGSKSSAISCWTAYFWMLDMFYAPSDHRKYAVESELYASFG